ncbi:MAG: histidinol phosphate phosphatase domain-containing protein [Methanobrevibacter sp.]
MTNKRIDLHMHSLFSDGELLPSELARRAYVLGHSDIAITDHVDYYNINDIIHIQNAIDDINNNWDINVILGVEITHVPPSSIKPLAIRARELGAKIVVVHGETLSEPVVEGTNHAAAMCPEVDIIGHPGLISEEDAILAKENDIALEISCRAGHCLGNGHVADIASQVGNLLIVDTDTHAPEDLVSFDKAYNIALGAGLSEDEAKKSVIDNPKYILKKHDLI